jgi:hypothetical protein
MRIFTSFALLLAGSLLVQTSFVESGVESGSKTDQIASDLLVLWPQGPPSKTDGLHDTFGFLNEQVVWFRHENSPGRSALRVPEFVKWEGWERPSVARGYQVGQQWQQNKGSLSFENCAINYQKSPGSLSARVEIVEEEVVRITMTVLNREETALEGVSSHLCWNHFRHEPLGKAVWARAGEEWVDFTKYVSHGPYRHFYFDRDPGTNAGPDLSVRALFTEYERGGQTFGAFIAASQAKSLMSNVDWPCTDLNVDFGTIGSGEKVSRQVFVGMGLHDRSHWLEVINRWLSR